MEDGPCGEGYSLIGDICQPTPEGYVETRTACEMGVDSREAAGVVQNYQEELARCREMEVTEPPGGKTAPLEPAAGEDFDVLELLLDVLADMAGGLASFFGSVF